MIGYIILSIGVRWGCRRHTHLPFERSRLLRLVVVLVVVAGTGHLVTGQFTLWLELLAKAGLIASGPLLLYVLGFWRPDEIQWFKGRIGLSRSKSE